MSMCFVQLFLLLLSFGFDFGLILELLVLLSFALFAKDSFQFELATVLEKPAFLDAIPPGVSCL